MIGLPPSFTGTFHARVKDVPEEASKVGEAGASGKLAQTM